MAKYGELFGEEVDQQNLSEIKMKEEDYERQTEERWQALKAAGWSNANIEDEKLRVSQWRVLKQIRPRFESWLNGEIWKKRFHSIEFIPHADFLEVFLFYETDADIASGNSEGISKALRERILSDLRELEYPQVDSTNIRFIFDSHENVVKNFKGSYFFRLR
jgi:hypothetical protein